MLISFCSGFFFYFYSFNPLAFKLSVVCLLGYSLPIIFSKKLMDSYGIAYARILFQEYMALS